MNRCTVSSVTTAVGWAQAMAWSRTPPRPTAGSWCRSPTKRDPGAGLVGDRAAGRGRCPGRASRPRRPAAGRRAGAGRPAGLGCGVGSSGPVAVVVPAPAVLVDQPGGRVSVGAGLGGGDLGRLQRRGHHHIRWPCRARTVWVAAARWSCRHRPRPRRPPAGRRRPGRRRRRPGWGRSGRATRRRQPDPVGRAASARRASRAMRSASTSSTCGEVSDRTCSGTSVPVEQPVHSVRRRGR